MRPTTALALAMLAADADAQTAAAYNGSTTLLGDVAYLADTSLTSAGADIRAILGGAGQPLANSSLVAPYDAPGPLGSAACAADACCVYKHAADTMAPVFVDASGQCTGLARGAIRLGFHDAAAWSLDAGYGGGGADGSVLLSDTEWSRPVNRGLEPAAAQMRAWHDQFGPYNATMADLVQLAAMAGVAACPGGPRMRLFVGRTDRADAALDNLLPDPTDDADTLLALFARKSIAPGGLVALIGAHTASTQTVVDVRFAGAPQDPTPGRWDNDYFRTTQDVAPPAGVFRFASDVSLADHPLTGPGFAFFGTDAGRTVWQTAFAAEYLRISVLGVYNLNAMTDCTKVLPLTFS